MTFLGLELNAGLTASLALAIVAAFWNYSSLSEINWETISAGALALLAGAGVEVLSGSQALGAFMSAAPLSAVTSALYTVGGLLVLVGAAVQSVQLLSNRWG